MEETLTFDSVKPQTIHQFDYARMVADKCQKHDEDWAYNVVKWGNGYVVEVREQDGGLLGYL